MVRLATAADAVAVGRLLHDFNVEFDDPTPPADALAERIVQLLDADASVLVGGSPARTASPCCASVPRCGPPTSSATSPSCTWCRSGAGQGLGRALLVAAIDHARERGADYMDLGTSETDTVARALYESLGFSNRGTRRTVR